MPDARSTAVPLRALALSLVALTAAVVAALFSPEDLLEQEILAGVLALIPGLLLAHYRKWPVVSVLIGAGMVILCGAQIASIVFGLSIEGSPFILFVIAPYIAIALGAGWFSEVRRFAREQKRAEQDLRRLETALETMQIGVSITDLDGRIVYTNPAEASMHGFTVDELINQDLGGSRRVPVPALLASQRVRSPLPHLSPSPAPSSR